MPPEPLQIHVTAAAQEVLALRGACTHLLTHLLTHLQTWQNARPEMDTRAERELLLTVLEMPNLYPCSGFSIPFVRPPTATLGAAVTTVRTAPPTNTPKNRKET